MMGCVGQTRRLHQLFVTRTVVSCTTRRFLSYKSGRSITMLRVSIIVFLVLAGMRSADSSSVAGGECFHTNSRGTKLPIKFMCYGVQILTEATDRANGNITEIEIYDSNIQHIPGNAFIRFSGSLNSLDLHASGIETIEPLAFSGLWRLEQLILWGNKLTVVRDNWFMNLGYVKTIDLSFNSISYVEESVFQFITMTENFYLDYNEMREINWNVFSILPMLKKVRIGMNPWSWWYRAMLSRQLNDQNVDYSDDWEDWGWLNKVVWDCVERGDGTPPQDEVLDCAVSELLELAFETFKTSEPTQHCLLQARSVINCSKSAASERTNKTAARETLQGFAKDMKQLINSLSTF